jgi:2-dehydropantoate 2-reductase
MRILIIGAGAIGCLIGGKLALSGHRVTFVERADYGAQLSSEGITVREKGATRSVRGLSRIISAAELKEEEFDLMVVAVKSFDTVEAVTPFKKHSGRFSSVLTFQNGIGNEEVLAGIFGAEKVLAGVITMPVAVGKPRDIEITGRKGGLGLAPLTPGKDFAPVTTALRASGFVTKTVSDYRSLKWSKLLLNMLCNASCAILNMLPSTVFEDLHLVEIEKAAVCEALGVMKKLSIPTTDLPGFPVNVMAFLLQTLTPSLLRSLLRDKVGGGRGSKKPSLHLDLSEGRKKLEVAFLNGAVAEQAARLGLKAPANELLSTVLIEIAGDVIPWETFRSHPEKLYEYYLRMKARR